MRIARLLLVIRILSMGFFIGSVVLAVWQQQIEWYVMVACVSMGIYLLACMGESAHWDDIHGNPYDCER